MRFIPLAVALSALLAVPAVHAQVPDHAVGFGIALNPVALVSRNTNDLSYLPLGLGDVYLPLLSGTVKIEPELGLWRISSSYAGSSSSGTLLRLGVGVFHVSRVGASTALYVGPRAMLVFTSSSGGSDRTDWIAGLAFGGEHFFSPHFSLGGEVQLNYEQLGQPSGSTSSARTSVISNNGLIFARLYL